MTQQPKLAGTVDVGAPESYTEPSRLRWRIHDFADRYHAEGASFPSPMISCFGFEWFLRVYPGGNKGDGGLLHLQLMIDDEAATPSTKFRVRILGSDGSLYNPGERPRNHKYNPGFGHGGTHEHRADIIDECLDEDGTLVIEIDLQVLRSDAPGHQWSPSPSLGNDLVGMLDSGDGADVTLVFGENENERIMVHRFILNARAPTLADWANGVDKVEFTDVDPPTFLAAIRFLYSDVFEQPETKAAVRSILELANRLGVLPLKLHAESALAKQGVAVGEAAETLLFAEAYTCPELKEASMDVIVSNYQEATATEAWKQVAESTVLLQEVTRAMHASLGGRDGGAASDAPAKVMKVSQLRRALESKGLDWCDGSREVLEKRMLLDPPAAPPRKKAKRAE